MSAARQEKVESLLQQEIGAYLLAEGYEGITGFLTITGAETSPDLEHAKIFFSVVGQDEDAVLQILHKHIYEIQGWLNKKLRKKIVPRIRFVPDRSGAYARHISKLIHQIRGHDNQTGA